MGLLSKTLLLSTEGNCTFYNFFTKNNFSKCGIFSPIQNFFVYTDCIGFDGSTICTSQSTIDFWNGTVTQKDKFLYFTKNDNFPFYQFFSFNQRDKIFEVAIYFSSKKNQILLICNENKKIKEKESEIINYFENLSNEQQKKITSIDFDQKLIYSKYEIDFTNPFINFLSKITNETQLGDILLKTLNKEIFYFLKSNFAYPGYIVKSSEYKYKILFVTKTETSKELLFFHLQNEFSELIYDDSTNIKIIEHGKAESKEDALTFMQAE